METHAGQDARIKPRALLHLLENRRVAVHVACAHARKQTQVFVRDEIVRRVMKNSFDVTLDGSGCPIIQGLHEDGAACDLWPGTVSFSVDICSIIDMCSASGIIPAAPMAD